MSALPREVQKKIDVANKAHAALYPKNDDEVKEPSTTDPQALIDSINAPEAPAPEDLGATLAEPAPAEPAEPAPAEPAPAEPAPVPEDTGWEHKYNTLAGKYNAEVPRLNNELKGLQDQISQLHQVLSTLKQPAEDPTPVAPSPLTLIKDEDIKEYGAEMIDVIKRGAMEAVSPEMAKLRAENVQLRESLSGVTTHADETARTTMFASLTQSVPEWEQINVAPEFLTWLQGKDVYTGAARGALLQQAFEASDATRVTAFFQGYQNEHAALTPSTPSPTPPAKTPAVDMATIAAPGKPKGGGSVGRTQEGKRIWRQAEIAAFYRDVQRGAYAKDRKAKDTIEADILAAGADGRVVA